ncbi:MAG: hypothetical protein MUO80_06170, partial [Dehalococcoidia bacterium]|nr:hypothetical protein [Dehalococcoidia bacterium]
MKTILSSRRQHHVVRISISLLMVALVAGMVGCGQPAYDLTITSTPGGPVTTTGEEIFTYDEGTVVSQATGSFGITERVSVASDGSVGNSASTGPSVSADGRYIAFESHASNLVPGDTNNAMDVFVHDRQTGVTERVSVASDGSQGSDSHLTPESGWSSIRADGRYVA